MKRALCIITIIIPGMLYAAAEPGVRVAPAENNVTLISADGRRFCISQKAARTSGYVNSYIELGYSEPIDIPISSDLLIKIIALMNEYALYKAIITGIAITTLQEGINVLKAGDFMALNEPIINYLTQTLATLLYAELKQALQNIVNNHQGMPLANKVALANIFIQQNLHILLPWQKEKVLHDFQQLYAWKIIIPGPILQHNTKIYSAQFSPDGTRIATRSEDNSVLIWDAKTRKLICDLPHEDICLFIKFSPDGTRILTVSDDDTVRIWDAKTGQQIGNPLDYEIEASSAEFNPDGTLILVISDTPDIWDVETGSLISNLQIHGRFISAKRWNADGSCILIVSNDNNNSLRIMDAQTGQQIGHPLQHDNKVLLVRFSPNGNRILTISNDNAIRIFDAYTGDQISSLPLCGWDNSAEWSPNGNRILTIPVFADNAVRIFDAYTGDQIGSLPLCGWVKSAEWSPNGNRILTIPIFEDNAVRIFDAYTGDQIGSLPLCGWVQSAEWSPDGSHIVTVSGNGTSRIWWNGIPSIEQILRYIAQNITPQPITPTPASKKPAAVVRYAKAQDPYQKALETERAKTIKNTYRNMLDEARKKFKGK